MKQNQQFDDIVLMQYADGELDDTTTLALEEALHGDKDLREKLKVHLKTRILLLESQMDYSLEMPQQLTNLLDSLEYQESVAKQSQRHKQPSPSATSWLASLFKPRDSGSFEANDDGTASNKRVTSLIIPLAITTAIAFLAINSQQTIKSLETSSLQRLQASSNTHVNYGSSSNNDALESRLDDLSNRLIATRGELQSYQQKLILTTSKSQVLEDEVAQMKDARPELYVMKSALEYTEEKLEIEGKVAQVSQEKYDNLANALVNNNRVAATRMVNRIETLQETADGIAITTAVAPLLGIAKLIEFTEGEIKNYCFEIDEIVASEKEILGEVSTLNKEVLTEYNINCLPAK